MNGLPPVGADNLAALQRLSDVRVRRAPQKEAPTSSVGPAAELDSADPYSLDPRTYKDYALIHVLLMGEKVADLADPERALTNYAPAQTAPPPPTLVPATRQAPSMAAGERVTVSVEEQHLEVLVREGNDFVKVELDVQSIQVRREPVQKSDPLVLDLDGDGVEISSVNEGSMFDLTGDGVQERTATAMGGDGFLALDRDGDGVIRSGRELFGDQHGAANGFAELAKFDDNKDGSINANDAVFDSLRLWRDSNRDGVSTAGELATLAELGIESIELTYSDTELEINGGTVAQQGTYRRVDGGVGEASDVLLGYLG